jgi:hypothetical protein
MNMCDNESSPRCSASGIVGSEQQSVISPPFGNFELSMKAERLPRSFLPSKSAVVIGKGRIPMMASGNRLLRALVKDQLMNYSDAKSKVVKSSIVTDILFAIQKSCPDDQPAFVRYDGETYFAVDESHAREKIASTFRDCLSNTYKSSSQNKIAKRRMAREQAKECQPQTVQRADEANDDNNEIDTVCPLPNLERIETFAIPMLPHFDSIDKSIFDTVGE